MSDSDRPRASSESARPAESDPIGAMRQHIAELESELTVAVNELADIEAGVARVAQRVADGIQGSDNKRAYDAVAGHRGTWEPLSDDVGIRKADIRVLRVLLAECHEWLAASEGAGVNRESAPPRT